MRFLAQLPDKIEPISISSPSEVVDIFVRLLYFVVAFAGILAVGVILYAGIAFMTAGESEERRRSATGWLKWGVIGIIVAMLSFGVIALVTSILTP